MNSTIAPIDDQIEPAVPADADAPESQEAQGRLRDLVRKSGAALPASMKAVIAHDITREVSLAWDLLQAGELSQEDYAQVVQDLEAATAGAGGVKVDHELVHALAEFA